MDKNEKDHSAYLEVAELQRWDKLCR